MWTTSLLRAAVGEMLLRVPAEPRVCPGAHQHDTCPVDQQTG